MNDRDPSPIRMLPQAARRHLIGFLRVSAAPAENGAERQAQFLERLALKLRAEARQ